MSYAHDGALRRNHSLTPGPNAPEFLAQVVDPLAKHLQQQFWAAFGIGFTVLMVLGVILRFYRDPLGIPSGSAYTLIATILICAASTASGLLAAQNVRARCPEHVQSKKRDLRVVAGSMRGRDFLRALLNNEPRTCHHIVLSEALRSNQ